MTNKERLVKIIDETIGQDSHELSERILESLEVCKCSLPLAEHYRHCARCQGTGITVKESI